MSLSTGVSSLSTAIGAKIKEIITTLSGKQATLVSGTNIKTVNSTTLLGSGDIVIPAGATGPQGPIGATGATGATGPAGTTVWSGITGKPTTLSGYGITDAAASSHTHSYLPLSGGTLTGRLSANPQSYASTTITGLTQAPIDTFMSYEPSAGSTPTYFPLTHQTALYLDGYRTHTSTGIYKAASGWTASHYIAIGGNDSYPTEAFHLNYGGSITHSNGYTFLHSANYNSYAPTLTGTGASGTWGINVTGNAATATQVITTSAPAGTPSIVNDTQNNTKASIVQNWSSFGRGGIRFNGSQVEAIVCSDTTGTYSSMAPIVASNITSTGNVTGNANSATYATTAGNANTVTNIQAATSLTFGGLKASLSGTTLTLSN